MRLYCPFNSITTDHNYTTDLNEKYFDSDTTIIVDLLRYISYDETENRRIDCFR